MPLRAFPQPLKVGTDICHIPRIHGLITRRHTHEHDDNGNDGLRRLQRFVKRVLTAPERAYFEQRFAPCRQSFGGKSNDIAVFLAGRFAAKEACRKACLQFDSDTRGFQRIMILPPDSLGLPPDRGGSSSGHKSSRPQGVILDRVYDEARGHKNFSGGMQEEEEELDGQLCEISISHDGEYATAVALVPDMSGDCRRRGA